MVNHQIKQNKNQPMVVDQLEKYLLKLKGRSLYLAQYNEEMLEKADQAANRLRTVDNNIIIISTVRTSISGTIAPDEVSEVIMDELLTVNEDQSPTRQAAFGGGLKAVIIGAQAIQTGNADIVVAGGQDDMCQAPHCVPMRQEKKMSDASPVDTILHDG